MIGMKKYFLYLSKNNNVVKIPIISDQYECICLLLSKSGLNPSIVILFSVFDINHAQTNLYIPLFLTSTMLIHYLSYKVSSSGLLRWCSVQLVVNKIYHISSDKICSRSVVDGIFFLIYSNIY